MTKPACTKKLKQRPAKYTLRFEGTDKVIENVLFKEIAIKDGDRHWAFLEKKGNQWIFLSTAGYLIEPQSDENPRLTFDRTDPEEPVLVNYFDERLPIKVFTFLNVSGEIYSIDESEIGTRIQFFREFMPIEDHNKITSISFTKEQ